MWKKWRGSKQLPILHGISAEHYAMPAQLFIDWSGPSHAHVSVPHTWGTLDRKSTLFKLIVKFFLKGVVFMFWHDVYIELLHCVTNFELVWTWNKVAVVEIEKMCRLYPTFPYANLLFYDIGLIDWISGELFQNLWDSLSQFFFVKFCFGL